MQANIGQDAKTGRLSDSLKWTTTVKDEPRHPENRNGPVYVGSFIPPSSEDVPILMEQFEHFLQSKEFNKMHPIRKAAYIHHQFTYIHPFV